MADAGPDEGPGTPQACSPSEEEQVPLGAEQPQATTAESGDKCGTETEAKDGSESTAKAGTGTGSETKPETESETQAESGVETKNKGKVDLLLKAAGDAPIMRQRLWKVDPAQKVTWVIQFIRRYIKMTPEESLFVYVSQAFSPSPDQTIGNLLDCFGSEGKLVLHYCKSQAWG